MASKTIGLVVTGSLEEKGWSAALGRYFPEASFLKALRLDSFTSAKLEASYLQEEERQRRSDEKWLAQNKKPPPLPEPAVVKLATRLCSLFSPSSPLKKVDLVVVLEDIELHNQSHPERIMHHFAGALNEVIAGNPKLYDSHLQSDLAERASFHLLCPMIESYFFADPQSLQAAGVDASLSRIEPRSDVERFDASSDEGYRQAIYAPKETLELPAIPPPPWEVSCESTKLPKEYHPKEYLKYLLKQSQGAPTYKETHQGLDSLKSVRWNEVFEPSTRVAYLRALFADIADFLGVPSPVGETALVTAPKMWKKEKLLRNLPKHL